MSAALTASPMVADPYACPRPMVRRTTRADGSVVATYPNDGPRRRMRDRLTDQDRNAVIRGAIAMGVMCGDVHPADTFADWRRPMLRSQLAMSTYDLRPSELAWIDAVGGIVFLAAKLDAAGLS